MTGSTGIRTSTGDGVRTVHFTRPEQRNAMDGAMFTAYYTALAEADDDPEVRAIVVTGDGDWFCSGAAPDALHLLAGDDAPDLETALGHPPHLPMTLRKPLIAAVNGGAAGLGLAQALFADVRFLAEGARLSTAFSRLGLIGEYGTAWLLPRLVGVGAAMDLLLSARKIDAAEAAALGLAQHVLPRAEVLPAAQEYARGLAAHCSPRSMAIIKQQVWRGLDLDGPRAVAESVRLMGESLRAPDFQAAVQRLGQRGPVGFPPLPPNRSA
ncbi:enoyl-CoA hydratase-related protein [Saccharopolyspora gregorii]|uniref:enoyl-CoA hydratase-related protein n=1 Tax=Saccharopolyspora gregorii TaxID=33914 RepID=UPI0021ABB25A|nr:enoyl-CoA hydratase-related protein [Saccharopolyspora gregorii]